MSVLRVLHIALGLWYMSTVLAQPPMPCELNTLPVWMQSVVSADKPVPCVLPKKEPVHTNAFIGRWSIQKEGCNRFDFWSDKQRVVIQEYRPDGTLRYMHFIDLAANVRLKCGTEKGETYGLVEDLYLSQASYYREIWSDTLSATGRTEIILGTPCTELRGTNQNSDSAYYWTTDIHPTLFADMRVWSPWLRREGDMEFLTALCSPPAGGRLRAQWPARKHGGSAGSIAFLSITSGATPMPTLQQKATQVAERRFLWMNSSGIGILPAWMRAYVSPLKQDTLPAAYTPAPVKRNIPDNAFIGTLTAEKSSMLIGLRNEKTGSDTTIRRARYSYWADARRAVLILNDPDDEGYVFYAVDLDADVVMASRNEMNHGVIPRMEIADLETVGLSEFGRGLEEHFTPTGKMQTILGRECELHTTDTRFINQFWFPKKALLNPIFDMKNWMVQRMGQRYKDLMMFGVADKPMPMQVMRTYLTSYKPGKVAPPVVDLTSYQVRDTRLDQDRRRNRSHEIPDVHLPMIGGEGTGDPEGHVVMEAAPMAIPEPPAVRSGTPGGSGTGSGSGGGEGTGSGYGEGPGGIKLSPELETVMTRTTNQFIGSARMEYTLTTNTGETKKWTVRYASTADKMVIIGRDSDAGTTEHTAAHVIDRTAGQRTSYHLQSDSTLIERPRMLPSHFRGSFAPAHPDSLTNTRSRINGRWGIKGLYRADNTMRASWVDMQTPSLYLDILGALKGWAEMDRMIYGGYVTIANGGMPLEVDYTYTGGDHLVMRLLELKKGPVDPLMFEISKDSWNE